MTLLYLKWREMLSNEQNSQHNVKIQISLLTVIDKDSSKACCIRPNLPMRTVTLP